MSKSVVLLHLLYRNDGGKVARCASKGIFICSTFARKEGPDVVEAAAFDDLPEEGADEEEDEDFGVEAGTSFVLLVDGSAPGAASCTGMAASVELDAVVLSARLGIVVEDGG